MHHIFRLLLNHIENMYILFSSSVIYTFLIEFNYSDHETSLSLFFTCYAVLSARCRAHSISLIGSVLCLWAQLLQCPNCFQIPLHSTDNSLLSIWWVCRTTISYFFPWYSQTILHVLIFQYVHHQIPICLDVPYVGNLWKSWFFKDSGIFCIESPSMFKISRNPFKRRKTG